MTVHDHKIIIPGGSRRRESFFITSREKDRTMALVEQTFPESIARTIHDADEICRHAFDLLGSGKTDLGPVIDWHCDFKSGFSWDPRLRYNAGEPYIFLRDSSDVKVPWDLSSFLHLTTLGKAYWYTGEEKYAREFTEEITGWIEDNPRPRGINWACTMKVAHRIINWVWGYYFFRNAPTIEPGFWERFYSSLESHGKFVFKHPEDRRPANNHYLLSLAALFYLGVSFPGMKQSGKWLKFSLGRLQDEIETQVYQDGVDYEGTTYYHRFASEIFLSVLILGRRNGVDFTPVFLDRLEKMLEFIMLYSRPGGSAPRIGDGDDGRVQILSNYSYWDPLDHRDLLSSGAVVFERDDFKASAGKFHEESFWLLGEEGLEVFQRLRANPSPPSSRSFPRGGFYIMRRDDLHLIADCLSPDPTAPVAHRHNSRLSFELSSSGIDFIVDPGTFTYTASPEQRNLFRSTGYHNTVIVDDREQSRLNRSDLFSLRPGGPLRVNCWSRRDDTDFLDAEYTYAKIHPLERRLRHRRQICFEKQDKYFVIRDTLRCRGSHLFYSHFHFNAGIRIVAVPGGIIASVDGRDLLLRFIRPENEEPTIEIGEGWVSERYGVKVKAPIVSYRGKFRDKISYGVVILPGPAGRAGEEAVLSKAETYFNQFEGQQHHNS
jgi:Heparinase II/III N-terminus/Heparinase II/III-like protein